MAQSGIKVVVAVVAVVAAWAAAENNAIEYVLFYFESNKIVYCRKNHRISKKRHTDIGMPLFSLWRLTL